MNDDVVVEGQVVTVSVFVQAVESVTVFEGEVLPVTVVPGVVEG